MMNNKTAHWPFTPARFPIFYGWLILAVGTLGVLMSVPGQTMGVSVFTDYLIEALELSRDQLSLAYMVGTLGSALFLPWGGRLYDRLGARASAALAGGSLSLVLVLLSQSDVLAGRISLSLGLNAAVGSFLVILPAFLALRLSGQGMLTLASRNMIAKWFDRRRGLVFGIAGIFIAIGFSSAPLAFEQVILAFGWRGAWLVMAAIIGLGFVPMILTLYRDNPEACGLFPDGKAVNPVDKSSDMNPELSQSLPQARRTALFWIFSFSFGLSALYTTGLTFHIVSAFESAGMTRPEAIAIFLPSSAIAVATHLIGGWLSDRVPLYWMLTAMLMGMILSMTGLSILASGWPVLLVIIGNGISMGLFSLLSGVTWPKLYGRKHLGAISGFSMSIVVFFSAAGPVLFSQSFSWTGSYQAAGLVELLAAALLTTAALIAGRKKRRQGEPS